MTAQTPPAGGHAADADARGAVLFLTVGDFSGTNAKLLKALKATRRDLTFDLFDVRRAVRASWATCIQCGFAVLREYGLRGSLSVKTLRKRFSQTRVFAEAAQEAVARHAAGRKCQATLQTQSLYNAAQPGIPNYVYTDHAALARDRTGKTAEAPSAAWLDQERAIYAQAAHVFTFGPHVRDVIVKEYGIDPEKTSYVGAGVNVERTGDNDLSLARYARRNIVFVGKDWERKGGPELLAAFRVVRARFPDATLTIVGCNPPDLPAGAEAAGRLAPEQVAAYYENASLFCFPTRLEPFGIAVAEAMQFALPVVSTTVGEISSMVTDGENGRLVPPRDPQALAQALIGVLESPERMQAMGARGAVRATEYTWQAVAQAIAEKLDGPK